MWQPWNSAKNHLNRWYVLIVKRARRWWWWKKLFDERQRCGLHIMRSERLRNSTTQKTDENQVFPDPVRSDIICLHKIKKTVTHSKKNFVQAEEEHEQHYFFKQIPYFSPLTCWIVFRARGTDLHSQVASRIRKSYFFRFSIPSPWLHYGYFFVWLRKGLSFLCFRDSMGFVLCLRMNIEGFEAVLFFCCAWLVLLVAESHSRTGSIRLYHATLLKSGFGR